jgi:hypothetical protein
MGTLSSTRWPKGYRKMTTVEETFVLGIKALAEVLPAPLRPGMHQWGQLPLWRADVELLLARFELNAQSVDHPYLLLHYAHPASQEHTTSRIMLQTTPLPRGGYQFHFVCPVQKHPRCHTLRRHLYLPLTTPQATFACILCSGPLAYLSAQQGSSRYAGMSSEFRQLLARDQARKKARLVQAKGAG